MRIVLRYEQKLNHLEEAISEAPPATATVAVRNAYTRRVNEQQEVSCLMLASITLEIQKNLEDRTAFDILHELKIMFQQSARIPEAPKRYGFYVDDEEHELRDHGEPTNYQAALSDPESDKWI
ncbi:hypothetical protein Tco_1214293 [Tanacetum coccineum]